MISWDINFVNYLYFERSPVLAKFFYYLTHLADVEIMIIFVILLAIYLFYRKEFLYLFTLLSVTIGTEIVVILLKFLVNRERPDSAIAYYIETSKSFPSGHAAISVAFFGFLIYYLVRHLTKRYQKNLVIILGVLLILLIGFSRLYLGVHYLSDVLGGFLIGGMCLGVGIWIINKKS